MVYLILFVEKCRDLKKVVTLGSNAPFVKVQAFGKTHRTEWNKEGTDPGALRLSPSQLHLLAGSNAAFHACFAVHRLRQPPDGVG